MVPIANIFSTLSDFPPFPSMILFTCGCNLRCKYCHNFQLLDASQLPTLDLDQVSAYLDRCREFADGLVVSGGEPTIHQYDSDFMHFLCTESKHFLLKLDSNGTIPIHEEFLDLFYGVSITLKPITYYNKESNIFKVVDNIKNINEHCSYKELRVTMVDDVDFRKGLDYIFQYLDDGWKITLNKAIKVETGTLDDDWNECNAYDIERLQEWIQNKTNLQVQISI